MKRQNGFTMLELLIVGVIILVFVGALLVVVRPQTYEAEQRNAQRRLGLAILMQVIVYYKNDYGVLPPSITSEDTVIGTGGEEDATDLCYDLVPEYLDDLPYDPALGISITDDTCDAEGQLFTTSYTVRVKEGGWLSLAAPAAEKGETIVVERWFPLL